jgi:hypothetical protein
MMALTPIVMHPKIDTCWLFMPEFLHRVEEFGRNEEWTARAKERFQAAFARGTGREMLGIMLVDDTGRAHGHCLAGVETMLGEPFVIVYQLGKDKGYDKGWARTTQRCQDMVDSWAMTLGITKCSVSVANNARQRLFLRHGYEVGPRLLHRDVTRQTNAVIQEPETAGGTN